MEGDGRNPQIWQAINDIARMIKEIDPYHPTMTVIAGVGEDKIRQLEQHGTKVSGRVPHVIPPNDYNRFYLETKARRSGHFIDLNGRTRLPEQHDAVQVDGMSPDALDQPL
jgi:hypothetical protein